MTRIATLAAVLLLGLAASPAVAGDGGTGFWITVGPPASSAVVVFLCCAFCALWAQNTGRDAWLWFVLGAVFNVATLVVLLYLNCEERKGATARPRSAE